MIIWRADCLHYYDLRVFLTGVNKGDHMNYKVNKKISTLGTNEPSKDLWFIYPYRDSSSTLYLTPRLLGLMSLSFIHL